MYFTIVESNRAHRLLPTYMVLICREDISLALLLNEHIWTPYGAHIAPHVTHVWTKQPCYYNRSLIDSKRSSADDNTAIQN